METPGPSRSPSHENTAGRAAEVRRRAVCLRRPGPRRGMEGRGVTANCGGHSPPFGGPGPGVLPRLHRAPSSGVRPTDGRGAGRGPTRPLAPCCLCPREVASFVGSSSGWWFIKYAFTCEARREGFIIVMGKPSVKGTIAKALARKAKIFLISIHY